ncbi:tryptophan synthase subunit alpha [Chloroflexota bacterium]
MSGLAAVFEKGRRALIAYLTVGYPNTETTLRAIPLLAESGCDIIELGIPFSDPLADGTTIQQASHKALTQGVTPRTCLDIATKAHESTNTPLVFMTYYNPVFHYGLETFCRDTTVAGVSGLIVPDLPPEEGGELEAAARRHGLDQIYLLAPTSNDERIGLVSRHARGFIYLVSLSGVTGARTSLAADLSDFVSRVRLQTELPLCVGFGISTPEQASQVAAIADGVIVGSRLLELIDEDKSLNRLGDFVSSLRSALDAM